MADDEEPAAKALILSLSAVITSPDSVNSSLVTVTVDSGASGYYFDDTIIQNLEHRPQNCVHLVTPHKIITAGGALLDGTVEGVLQDLVTDDYGNQILVRVDVVVVPEIGRNLCSVINSSQKGHCDHHRLKIFGVGGIQGNRAATERER